MFPNVCCTFLHWLVNNSLFNFSSARLRYVIFREMHKNEMNGKRNCKNVGDKEVRVSLFSYKEVFFWTLDVCRQWKRIMTADRYFQCWGRVQFFLSSCNNSINSCNLVTLLSLTHAKQMLYFVAQKKCQWYFLQRVFSLKSSRKKHL